MEIGVSRPGDHGRFGVRRTKSSSRFVPLTRSAPIQDHAGSAGSDSVCSSPSFEALGWNLISRCDGGDNERGEAASMGGIYSVTCSW